MSTTELTVTAAGGLIVVLATIDLFLTVFDYDGFEFVAGRYQRLCWRAALAVTALLPGSTRRAARSLGSAGLLPATVALWLAAEIAGFALMYRAGISAHGFSVTKHLSQSLGSAFYLSAGASRA